ncbi:putative cruciform DNA binding protein [Gigaspora margarita]|nr:putative cruciform DNA binding protein [Gigaspora margarita]
MMISLRSNSCLNAFRKKKDINIGLFSLPKFSIKFKHFKSSITTIKTTFKLKLYTINMSSSNNEPSKIGGDAKYYQGAVKETVGKALGNEQMQAEGTAKKLEGKTESDAAKNSTKDQTRNKTNNVVGGAKETVGSAIGDEQLQAQGRERKNNDI